MSTPVKTTRYQLRASSPVPYFNKGACDQTLPDGYILQTFGVDISVVDNWDSIVGLFGSEVMQGRQNFEDSPEFRESSFTKISYSGSNEKNTDGDMVFKGNEEHTSSWDDEESSGLIWLK